MRSIIVRDLSTVICPREAPAPLAPTERSGRAFDPVSFLRTRQRRGWVTGSGTSCFKDHLRSRVRSVTTTALARAEADDPDRGFFRSVLCDVVPWRTDGFPASTAHEVLDGKGGSLTDQSRPLVGRKPLDRAALELALPRRILAPDGALQDAAKELRLEGVLVRGVDRVGPVVGKAHDKPIPRFRGQGHAS